MCLRCLWCFRAAWRHTCRCRCLCTVWWRGAFLLLSIIDFRHGRCAPAVLVKVELMWFFAIIIRTPNWLFRPYRNALISTNVNYGLLNGNLIANDSIMWRLHFRFAFNGVFADLSMHFYFIFSPLRHSEHADWECAWAWVMWRVSRGRRWLLASHASDTYD